MSSDKYCATMVKNVEETLAKRGLRLPSKCPLPLSAGYKPELDSTVELKADGVQFYQEIVGCYYPPNYQEDNRLNTSKKSIQLKM